MPPPTPTKVLPPTAVPAVAATPVSMASRAARERASMPGTTGAVRAQPVVGNATTAAAMGATPPGAAVSGLPMWQALLAAQDAVGNGALAVALAGPAAPLTAPRTAPSAADPAEIVHGAVSPAGTTLLGTAPAAKERPAEPATAVQGRPEPGLAAAHLQSGEPGPVTAPAPAEAGAAVRRGPHADPKFVALKRDVRAKQRSVAASHPPAKVEAGAAQAAARPPADDREAQGKTANAEKMDAAKPREFDKATFIKAVEEAIAKRAPQNLKAADEFGDSGKADEVKREVQGRVGEGKDASAAEIATTTAAPPDTSKALDKQVVPLAPDKPPPVPGAPDPAGAVPDKLPPSATDLSAGPAQLDQQMAGAHVTEPQLAKSNEPQFVDALGRKQAAERDSVGTQARMRAHEKATLAGATADARQFGAAGMAGIGGARVVTGRQVGAGKAGAKGRDEAKRAQVTATLQRVFDATKKDVEDILSGLDRKVDEQFSREEKQARDAFTTEHKRKMADYKDRRYAGAAGKLRWFDDWVTGLPDEANQLFVEARDHYVARMRTVIANIADTVAAELGRAKRRIADGRTELQATVKRLPAELRSIGQEAAADFADRFDELTQSVDDKGTELVDTLADKYTEALKSVDEEIAAEKEKNKGWVDKAKDAIRDTIKTITELKNLLLGVLRKAAQAVMAIINDPIGFLRNLVGAVGAGLKLFMKNIGKHLQQGLMAWLLGVSAQAGIQLPTKFDVRGIVMMIASLIGLSWINIRARIVRKVPEPAVAAAETAVPLVGKAKREGVGGLWDDMKSRVGDLKQTLFSKVIAYLTPTIIIAGIIWVLSLLNPASAFVRACKLIIDIVRFIVERGRQVIEFVDAVLDAVIAIAKGGGGGVPALIERALARSIPVLIGFLAAILGVGGIAGKVKKIVQELSRPVNKAVDWVIDKIVGLVKRLWAKLKAALERGKRRRADRRRKDARPEDSRRRDPRRRRPRRKDPRRQRREDPRRPQADDKRDAVDERVGKRKALDAALRQAERLLLDGRPPAQINAALPAIRSRFRLSKLKLVLSMRAGREVARVEGTINPTDSTPTHPYAVESRIRILENKVQGRQILADVREMYQRGYGERVRAMEKNVAIVRFEAAPGDAPDWRARMEASHVSARQKVRNIGAVGFEAVERVLPHDIPPGEFGEILQQYNTDPSCVGLIVQLPVRQRYQDFVSLIAPHKDIDALLRSRSPYPVGATSEGISRVVEPFVQDKPTVAVVGSRGFVGEGVVNLVKRHDVHVIQLDIGDELNRVRNAKVVISVTGRSGILGPGLILPTHRLVVDSGFVPEPGGGVSSDVAPEAVNIPRQITPVPGGIGPVEMAILLERLIRKEVDPTLPPWRLVDPEGHIRP